jgi:hypothetical protein
MRMGEPQPSVGIFYLRRFGFGSASGFCLAIAALT